MCRRVQGCSACSFKKLKLNNASPQIKFSQTRWTAILSFFVQFYSFFPKKKNLVHQEMTATESRAWETIGFIFLRGDTLEQLFGVSASLGYQIHKLGEMGIFSKFLLDSSAVFLYTFEKTLNRLLKKTLLHWNRNTRWFFYFSFTLIRFLKSPVVTWPEFGDFVILPALIVHFAVLSSEYPCQCLETSNHRRHCVTAAKVRVSCWDS